MEPNTQNITDTSSTALNIGDLFQKSIALFRVHYKKFFIIGIIPVSLLIVHDILQFTLNNVGDRAQNGFIIAFAVIFFILNLIVQLVIQVLYIKAVKECDEGLSSSIKELYRFSFKLFWPSLLITFLVTIVGLGATIPFIIPGIIVSVYLAFARYFLVLEDKRGMEALTNSYYYVKGLWWKVLSRLVVLGLVIILSVFLLGVILSPVTGAFMFGSEVDIRSIGALISNIVFSLFSYIIIVPFYTLYLYFIYKDLKEIKPAPSTNADLDTPKKWFIGLAIWVPIAMILGAAVFAIVAMTLR